MHVHIHTHMFACSHTQHTHTQQRTKQKQSLLAAAKRSRLPSEPALGYLCATQVLGVSSSKSSWGRTSSLQGAVPCLTDEGVGTQSPTTAFTHYARHGQFGVCFPSLYQPVNTRPPGPHLYSWVDWSNVSKVPCSRKQQQHQSGHTGNQTWDLLITRPMP